MIELLDAEECGRSAGEIEDMLRAGGRRVGRATIYRVLDELDRLGLVTRIEIGDGITRYESVFPGGTEHHHHLVCGRCGTLTPVTDDALEKAIRRVARRESFAVDEHDVTLHGMCANCGAAQ